MLTPIQQLKKDMQERYEYWQHKSSKGAISNPTVVAGVLASAIDRINELFPKEKAQVVIIKRVLKRKV